MTPPRKKSKVRIAQHTEDVRKTGVGESSEWYRVVNDPPPLLVFEEC